MTKKGYLSYIHNFRGLAIILILGIHTRTSMSWNNETYEEFFITLLNNSTILFVFISGFLFQYLSSKKFEYKNYISKKLLYVILPYVIISIPAIVHNLLQESPPVWLPEALEGNVLLSTLYMIATGKHLGPLWYMPMIFVYFLIAPLFLKINRSWFYIYIYPVIFILGLFTFRFGYFSNTFDSFLTYLPVYLFGMMSSYFLPQLLKLEKYLVLFLILYVGLFLLEFLEYVDTPYLANFITAREMPEFAFSLGKLRQMVLCILLLLTFKRFENKDSSFLKISGDYSFGIYFVHMYLLIFFGRFINKFLPNLDTGLLAFFVIWALTVLISGIIVHLVRKIIPTYSRYVIGS